MLHDPVWRAVASLGLVLLVVGMLRMAGKFLADRQGEAFAEDHAQARLRFQAWFDLSSSLHGTLLRVLVVLALLAVVARREPCAPRDFLGDDLFAALLVAARFAYQGLLLAAAAVAPLQLVVASRFAFANRRAAWNDERAKHTVVVSLVVVPLALTLEWLALRIVWGRDCPFDPFLR